MRLWSNSLERDASPVEFALVATLLMAFLVATGQQKLQTVARLASFTNKLGVAVLVAALIRVRDGWPGVTHADFDRGPLSREVWAGISDLAFYAAPVLLLASSLSHRIRKRRELVLVSVFGVSAPLVLTLLLVGVIGAATHASNFYQPSLQPSVAMALWSRAARSGVQGNVVFRPSSGGLTFRYHC